MLRGTDLLVGVRSWISAAEANLPSPGAASEVEESPNDRDPRSIRWILESFQMMGQIIIWEDGQSEIDLADVASRDVRSEHRRIGDQRDLDAALGAVRDWVVRTK